MSPLDTLKTLVHVADNLIGIAQEYVSEGQDEQADEILESTRAELWRALGAHVEGVRPECPHFTDIGRVEAKRYDDGTPVFVTVDVGNGMIADYYPRRDGTLEGFLDLLRSGARPSLSIVPTGGS